MTECLLCKHEDMNSNLRTCEQLDVAVHACDPNTGEHRDSWVPAHMPASIAQPNGELLF